MTLLSRSSAMLNEIDPKQAQEQIQAVRKTLQEYAKQEAQLAQLITPASASAAETALLQQVQAAAQRPGQRLRARCKQRTMATPSPPA